MPTPTLLEEAQTLCEAAQYLEAQTLLNGYRPSAAERCAYLRTLGWNALQLGQVETGLRVLEQATEAGVGLERAKALTTLGAALHRSGQFERSLTVQRQALPLFERHPQYQVQTLYNLGMAELCRVRCEEAQHYFETALALTRSRKAAASLRGTVLLGLSSAARLAGELEAAEYRARQAALLTLSPQGQLSAARLLACAQRSLGQAGRAQDTLHAALAHLPQGDERISLTAHLAYAELQDGLLEGVEARLESVLPLLMPLEAARCSLFLAEAQRQRGEECKARATLEGALEMGQRYPVTVEASLLNPLYLLGRLAGLELPHLTTSQRPSVQLETLGHSRVHFLGRTLPLSGSGRAVALLAYLILEGSQSWEVVAEAVLEPADPVTLYRTLNRTLSRVRDLLGSRDAVQLEGGVLRLHSGWAWSCDALEGSRRNFLPGLYTDWAEGMRSSGHNGTL